MSSGPQVLYVEHPPVYTAGRRTEPHERPFDGTPVVDVDRGGKITYHGPGQLVGYPIVFLPRGIGVVDYVRRVEEALIRLLAGYGVATGRVPGRTGVWLAADDGRPERKIAAIGIRVSRQTTMHGFALNVSSDLADFGRIVPVRHLRRRRHLPRRGTRRLRTHPRPGRARSRTVPRRTAGLRALRAVGGPPPDRGEVVEANGRRRSPTA